MSSKAKAQALEDTEDDDVAAMLQAQYQPLGDPEEWLRDKDGDLDWGYTARVVRKWSYDALLTHIWENSFSIPARIYNPSAPFVYVKLHDGQVVTLPHGYRLPLMFIAKYYWQIALTRLKNRESWKKERDNVFHLSRLCENLFRRARAKSFTSGMEKGWRCLMFDRLLARFYKGWYRNDPQAGRQFVSTFGVKEYDRDVLKHDWKRWCMRGINGVKMTETEVVEGISIEQFREGLVKDDDGTWKLGGEPLPFIAVDEYSGWSSVSELTDCDMDTEEDASDTSSEEEDTSPEDGGPESQKGKHPENATSEKRTRPITVDEDELERASKRARIQPITISSDPPSPPHPLRLAGRANSQGAVPQPGPNPDSIHSSSRIEASRGLSLPNERPTAYSLSSTENDSNTPGRTVSRNATAASSSKRAEDPVSSRASPDKRVHSSKSPDSVVVVSRSKPKSSISRTSRTPDSAVASQSKAKPSFSRSFSSISAHDSSSKAGPSSKSVSQIQRTTGSKPRQTRASRLAGVATVNVYVSDGKPRAKFQAKSKPRKSSPAREPSRSQSPSGSNPPRDPPLHSVPIPSSIPPQPAPSTTNGPLPITGTAASADDYPSPTRDTITAKALELLVNLVDTKQVLRDAFNKSSSTSSSAEGSNDANQPADGNHIALEGRFQNLEDRFSSVREELKDIIERLQGLEKETDEQRELKKVVNERALEEKGVDCRPVTKTLGVETDRREVRDVAIGEVNNNVLDKDGDVKMDERVLGEMAVQTEPEEERHRSQQPDSHPEDSSKGEQTPTQEVVLTSIEMRTSDRNCGSETDTDSTVNIVKDDLVDPRAQEMSENLSLLVSDLVSVKMLSVVGDMLKGKARDPAVIDLDTSLRSLSPLVTPSPDSFALTNLLDDIKTLKEESRAREIRDKEEMQAMRQLHSAEVDALRRRLSYLESQNHHLDPECSSSGGRYRSSLSHATHIRDVDDDPSERGRHIHHPRHSDLVGRNPVSEKGDVGRTPSLDSISTANPRTGSGPPLPTPVPSERSFSFARPGHEREDELPLPIKSQRKQHMSFPRTTFS